MIENVAGAVKVTEGAEATPLLNATTEMPQATPRARLLKEHEGVEVITVKVVGLL